MNHNFYCALLAFFLAACSASLPYAINYPLTNDVFYSRDAEFHGRVPEGWFVSPLDSLSSTYQVWLIKNDYSATFHVEELRLDELSAKQVNSHGMLLLAKISLAFHKESPLPVTVIAEPREFKMHEMEFCGYELKEKSGVKRVVVFSNNKKFYECMIVPVGHMGLPPDLTKLFNTQQTVLASLTFR